MAAKEYSYNELEKEYDGLGEDFAQLLDKYKTLKEENNKLKTQINDNQKALADANRRWDFLYRMGAIEYDDYFSFQQYLAAMEI